MKLIYGPTPEDRMPYDLAFLYCLTLDHDGHKDWQLPDEGLNISTYLGSPRTPYWVVNEVEDELEWFCVPVRYVDD